MREVLPGEWAAALAELDGLPVSLTGIERSGRLELWVRSDSGDVVWVALAHGLAPSLAQVWPVAVAFERAIAWDFGVEFEHCPAGPGDLRKNVLLAARNQTPWPGAKEPGDSAGSPSRRKLLPAGVSAELPEGSELR